MRISAVGENYTLEEIIVTITHNIQEKAGNKIEMYKRN